MKKYVITVNGAKYEVVVEEADINAKFTKAETPKAAPAGNVSGTEVKAPMPGTVLNVVTQVGATVNNGDVLLVLEAMKMENEIVAPCAGTVKAINVSKDDAINTGDLLVVIG